MRRQLQTASKERSPTFALPTLALLAFALFALAPGCSSAGLPAGPLDEDPVDAPDTTALIPIDLGNHGAAPPGQYRGLPLKLIEHPEPSVTPVDDLVGVVCVGMSNSNQECRGWLEFLDAGAWSEVSERVRIVNCAVGGHALERWIDPAFDDELWGRCVNQRIPAAGLTPGQIRVIYHKAATQFNMLPGGVPRPLYPDPESAFQRKRVYLDAFAGRVPEWFPAVQAVYTASRSYGGFTTNPARGEPLSYEAGHALNVWLTANATASGVPQRWGPYLWAPDCASGGMNGSGICYLRQDYRNDGVHPTAAGEAKMAGLIHARFLREGWYRR